MLNIFLCKNMHTPDSDSSLTIPVITHDANKEKSAVVCRNLQHAVNTRRRCGYISVFITQVDLSCQFLPVLAGLRPVIGLVLWVGRPTTTVWLYGICSYFADLDSAVDSGAAEGQGNPEGFRVRLI